MIYLILSSIVDREIKGKISSQLSPKSPNLSPYPSSVNNIKTIQLIGKNDTTTSNKCPSLRLTGERVPRSLENKTIGKGSTPFAGVRA